MFPTIFIHRTAAMALAAVFMVSSVANAQTDCNKLAETLRDERDVRFDYKEAREVYNLVCRNNENISTETSGSSISGSYKLFSADARRNKSSVEEYRSAFCHISEDQLMRIISWNVQERSTSSATLTLLSQCLSRELGINLTLASYEDDTRVVIGLQDAHVDERSLNRIIAPKFECRHGADTVDRTGRNGEKVILTDQAIAIDCERQGKPRDINGVAYTHYPTASLTLDLSTGVYTLELPARDLSPVVYEFTDLQERVGELEVRNTALSAENGNLSNAVRGYMNRRWCEVTRQRKRNRVYTNNEMHPIEIAVTTDSENRRRNFCEVRVYVTNPDDEELYIVRNADGADNSAKICSATVTIPPGRSYRVETEGHHWAKILRWTELRGSCP